MVRWLLKVLAVIPADLRSGDMSETRVCRSMVIVILDERPRRT